MEKYPPGHLAGGLPYFTSSLGEGEGCKALPYPSGLSKFDSSGSLPFVVFSVLGFDFAIAVRPL